LKTVGQILMLFDEVMYFSGFLKWNNSKHIWPWPLTPRTTIGDSVHLCFVGYSYYCEIHSLVPTMQKYILLHIGRKNLRALLRLGSLDPTAPRSSAEFAYVDLVRDSASTTFLSEDPGTADRRSQVHWFAHRGYIRSVNVLSDMAASIRLPRQIERRRFGAHPPTQSTVSVGRWRSHIELIRRYITHDTVANGLVGQPVTTCIFTPCLADWSDLPLR